jgi:hypothetical protein
MVKTLLQNHFRSKKLSHAEIIDWVDWFHNTYGSPIFYERPVPQYSTWDPKSPDYQVSTVVLFLLSIYSSVIRDPVVS